MVSFTTTRGKVFASEDYNDEDDIDAFLWELAYLPTGEVVYTWHVDEPKMNDYIFDILQEEQVSQTLHQWALTSFPIANPKQRHTFFGEEIDQWLWSVENDATL